MHANLECDLQVDIGAGPAAGDNVFDESDDKQQERAAPFDSPAQHLPEVNVNKLADLANKKRKEMVSRVCADTVHQRISIRCICITALLVVV